MTFANPLGLLGLLAVPLILALHLLRERRQRQVVSNIKLWSFLEEEVRGPKPRRVPITWLLIFDLLIGLLLGLALAQPNIQVDIPVKDARQVVILLDISVSMQSRDRSPNRLAQAVTDATLLINQMNAQDIVTVITFGEQVNTLADTREVDAQTVLVRLSNLQAVEIGHEIDGALALGLSLVDNTIPAELHVFTDGAFPLTREESIAAWRQLPHPITWHFYKQNTKNQAVLDVTAQVVSENQVEVFARIANYGRVSSDQVLVLLADNEPVNSTAVKIPPDSTITHIWTLDRPAASFTVSLAGGDAYPVDDTFTTSVIPFNKVRVVYVTDDPAPIDRAIQAIPNAELTIYSPSEYSPHYAADLTIFRGTLPVSWPEGTVWVVEPPENSGSSDLIFPSRLEKPRHLDSSAALLVQRTHPLMDGVDLGNIRWVKAWELAEVPDGFASIVQAGDVPILLQGNRGNSEIVVLLADLKSGNFSKDPAFVILLLNIVNSTQKDVLPVELMLNHHIPLPEMRNYQLLRITNPASKMVEYRQDWPASWVETKIPGAYLIELQDASGKLSRHVVGINAADPDESDLDPQEWANNLEIEQEPKVNSQTVAAEQIINLTPYVLGIVILLLLAEALLAWR